MQGVIGCGYKLKCQDQGISKISLGNEARVSNKVRAGRPVGDFQSKRFIENSKSRAEAGRIRNGWDGTYLRL